MAFRANRCELVVLDVGFRCRALLSCAEAVLVSLVFAVLFSFLNGLVSCVWLSSFEL